jgi:hypothetical protein
LEAQFIIVILVVVFSTALYGVGLISSIGSTPVEPQSVFTLYGTVLGYLFGSREKKHDQNVEIAKKELGHDE